MKIFINRIEQATIKNFRFRRGGKFLERLIGVNVSLEGYTPTVEPVYLPAIWFERIGSSVSIQIGWNKPKWAIYLMPARPFISVVTVEAIQLEAEE